MRSSHLQAQKSFSEAHDVLEEMWRTEKSLLQGVILLEKHYRVQLPLVNITQLRDLEYSFLRKDSS
ncbi:DUF309 domain-containing protein [Candidatus Peregrinibacteria bacterium]|nr:DUF309 domain-containing protein [Candidatus Peregrinibacteria bacterium]